jgi:xyloglucan galactosyltransferase MUR3
MLFSWFLIRQLIKSSPKGGGRRTAGAKGMEKTAANALPPLRFLAVLAVTSWTFFLYLHFSVLSGTTVVEVSHGDDDDSADPCRGRYI